MAATGSNNASRSRTSATARLAQKRAGRANSKPTKAQMMKELKLAESRVRSMKAKIKASGKRSGRLK